ncbi:MAG: STAS domain-containing protein [Methanobrevibacter sp.]|nr:STAS domain-containing protein [Methanobrevibacter sp.]
MDINKELNGNTLTIKLVGRLDTNTAPELDSEIKKSAADVSKLILDFSDLDYISSAGLRVVLFTHKLMDNKEGLIVKNINSMIMEVLEATGFTDVLTIE